MNYVVFDLEWNQSYGGFTENPRMPFEIIEIGAVKLDSKFNITDSFSSLIRPKLYKKLQPHIRSILNYDEKDLKTGKPFDMVCRDFIKWCGDEDYIFCTWGPMDLSYLQNNMDYYYMKPLPAPLKYYNVQQIYTDLKEKDGNIVKLEKAVSNLSIDIDRPFHSAVNDAYYTAQILAKIHPRDLSDRYSYDVYNNPKAKEDEIISYHKHYMEHISREFDDKKDIMMDKELATMRCYKCGKKAAKKIKWFTNTPNAYISVCKCWAHGLMISKIKIKQNKNLKYFAIKTVLPTDRVGLENIRQRQEELRLRRQQKRHKGDDVEVVETDTKQ